MRKTGWASYFIRHQRLFEKYSVAAAVHAKLNQLASASVYGLIRQKKDKAFAKKLTLI